MLRVSRRFAAPSPAARARDDQPPRTPPDAVATDELVRFLRGKLKGYASGSLCRERLEEIIDDLEQEAR